MQKIIELAEYLDENEIGLYYTGGKVRDTFFNVESNDVDMVAFGCSFDYLQRICNEKLGLGLKTANQNNYPVLSGIVDGTLVEITIPRSLKDGSNSVRPDENATIEQDALRRDFTCNSLYENVLTGEIIDPCDGLADINSGTLRVCNVRAFKEDNRRVLRAAQMISRFGLLPGRQLMFMCKNTELSNISNEVLGATLKKILIGKDIVTAFKFLVDINAIQLFGSLKDTVGYDQKHSKHQETLFEHLVLAAELGSEHNLEMALAGLYHDVGKVLTRTTKPDGEATYIGHEEKSVELVRPLLISYGLGTDITNKVCELIQYHMRFCCNQEEITTKSVRKLHEKLNYCTFNELLTFAKIDQLSRRPQGNFDTINVFLDKLKEVPEVEKPFESILKGRHLIDIFNMEPGISMGQLLVEAQGAQTNGEFLNLSGALLWVGQKLGVQPKRIRVDLPVTQYDIANYCQRHGFPVTKNNLDIVAQKIREEAIRLFEGWGE